MATRSGSRPVASSGDPQTLQEMGEFPLIALMTRQLVMPPAVSVGPGDDGAVFLVNGSAVVSVDVLIEGVHFRRDWSSATEIGRKAIAVNVADLEAMGAIPLVVVIGFAAPGDLPVQWAREFMTGVREEADRAGVTLVGGDTSAARDISISATVIGQTGGVPVVSRSGAHAGQVVAFRGRLGYAAAGLAALGRGFRSPRAAVDAQRCPQPPYGAGHQAAQAGATAMIDVSDGLLADLGHIVRASDVAIDLDSGRFVIPDPVQAVAAATGRNPLEFVLTGGEDHALVATFELGAVPDDWQVIGVVTEPGEEGPDVTVDGRKWDGEVGWTHFQRG